jgi:hypothetical protein
LARRTAVRQWKQTWLVLEGMVSGSLGYGELK